MLCDFPQGIIDACAPGASADRCRSCTGVHDSMAASGQSDSKGCTGGKCRVAIDGVNYKSLASTHVRKVERQILQDSGECSRDCSGHGSCILNATTSGQSCQCEAGWDPQMDCQGILNCTSLSGCSGHGICVKGGKCACDPGWSGPACAIASCKIPPHASVSFVICGFALTFYCAIRSKKL